MTGWKRMSTIALPVCAATAIMFGLLPRTWIELRFGVDPDGGSGLFEFLIAALPIAFAWGWQFAASYCTDTDFTGYGKSRCCR